MKRHRCIPVNELTDVWSRAQVATCLNIWVGWSGNKKGPSPLVSKATNTCREISSSTLNTKTNNLPCVTSPAADTTGEAAHPISEKVAINLNLSVIKYTGKLVVGWVNSLIIYLFINSLKLMAHIYRWNQWFFSASSRPMQVAQPLAVYIYTNPLCHRTNRIDCCFVICVHGAMAYSEKFLAGLWPIWRTVR